MRLSELTALYSLLDVEYNQAMSGPYEDLSVRNDKCEVVAGLKDGRITGFWRPVVAVGDERELKLQIERLYDISQDIVYMDFLEGGRLSVISQFLLRHGYKVTPYYTQIIDLTQFEEDLHAGLRKSYKSLINNVRSFVDHGHWGSQIISMKQLHHAARGKQTRSDASWLIQSKMIGKGQAFIAVSQEVACMVYVSGVAYYAVGACDKGKTAHSAMWTAILEAKEMGCKMFEMGEQVFSGDPKLVNISKFKKGFGGQTITRLILEKETK